MAQHLKVREVNSLVQTETYDKWSSCQSNSCSYDWNMYTTSLGVQILHTLYTVQLAYIKFSYPNTLRENFVLSLCWALIALLNNVRAKNWSSNWYSKDQVWRHWPPFLMDGSSSSTISKSSLLGSPAKCDRRTHLRPFTTDILSSLGPNSSERLETCSWKINYRYSPQNYVKRLGYLSMQHGIRVWLGLGLGAVIKVREETRTCIL